MKLWSEPSRPLFLSCAFKFDELCLSSFVPGLRSDEQGCPSIGTAWPGAVGPGFRFAAHAKPPAAALVPAKTVSRMPEIPPLAVRRFSNRRGEVKRLSCFFLDGMMHDHRPQSARTCH